MPDTDRRERMDADRERERIEERLAAIQDRVIDLRKTMAGEPLEKRRLVADIFNLAASIRTDLLAALDRERERVERLEAHVRELADEVEASVRHEYRAEDGDMHPALVRRYERDMEPVRRAREALQRGDGDDGRG